MPTDVPSDEATLFGTREPEVAPPKITLGRGASVGRYVIIERLGAGAMGVVYKAFDPELDRVVAIKLLLGDGSRKGALGRSRLTREAQAMARIAHPNVIAVYDVGTVGTQVFFAMELVDGEPLGAWLARTKPSPSEILEVFRKAGAGIAAAHAAGVIHRDFKPDNVLVDNVGRPRVLDFGLARQGAEREEEPEADPHPEVSSSFDVQLTRTGAVLGTPAYMAPEQFAGKTSDERTDQFAFCVALHEALTGKRPFRSYSFATLSAAVIRGERTHTPEAESLDPAILAALNRGLETSPEGRFESMTALLEALSPAERSPAGLVFVGVAVLATATAAAYGLGRKSAAPTPEPKPCAGAGAAMEEAWTEERRQAVLSAFERSGAFNRASMGTRVVKVLDGHAAAWVKASARSCAMAGSERVFTEEIAFRSTRCLDEALSEFEGLLESFETLGRQEVQSSLSQAEHLPDAAACNEVGWLELQVDTPLDPELRASLSEVLPVLDEARRAEDSDNAQRCLEQLSEVEPRARALDFGPALTRLLALRADCELAVGDAEAAAVTRERAFESALGAADDLTAIRISTTTAHVLATTTDDFEAAEAWIRRADALLQRHKVNRSTYLVPVFNVRGILAARQNKTEEAIGYFRRVATLSLKDPAGAERYIAGMGNVGAALANVHRAEEAAEVFRESVAFAREHWGPRHENTARAQGKLAQVLVMQGRFEEARAAHLAVLEGLRAANDEPRLPMAYTLLSLGIVERNLGNIAAAKRYYEESYSIRETLGALETLEAAPLFNAFAILATLEDEYDDAASWHRRGIEVLKDASPLLRASPVALLAGVRIRQGNQVEARSLTQEAEVLALSAKNEGQPGDRGTTLYTIARNWSKLGNQSRAMALFEQAEQATKGTSSRRRVSAYRVAYAEALRDEGRNDEALEVLKRAQEQLTASPYPKDVVEKAEALRKELTP